MVKRLVEAGCDPVVAAEVVTECFSFGINSAPVHPNPPDSAAEKRRYWDREYRRRKRDIPPESTRIHPNSENDSLFKESKKENKKRGCRIPPDWLPSPEAHSFALREGLTVAEIDREVQNFRDYWTARPGAGGLKSDWEATWRNRIRSTAERKGRTPALPANGSTPDAGVDWDKTAAFYAKTGVWSRWAGPDPDDPRCQCPREVLERYGIEVPQ